MHIPWEENDALNDIIMHAYYAASVWEPNLHWPHYRSESRSLYRAKMFGEISGLLANYRNAGRHPDRRFPGQQTVSMQKSRQCFLALLITMKTSGKILDSRNQLYNLRI
jgi:hypothetical protein